MTEECCGRHDSLWTEEKTRTLEIAGCGTQA